jgi:hypothetical protein
MPSAESGRDSDSDSEIRIVDPSSATSVPGAGIPASTIPLPSVPMSSGAPVSSGRRATEHVAWGAVRDAITSIHNLEVLLKSPRIGTKVLAGVLSEFLEGISVLRGAFSKASKTAKTDVMAGARRELAELARVRLDELERTMQRAMTSDFDARGRLGLEQVVTRVSVDLDAAAELLDLSDRAEHPMETEVSLDELARVSLQRGAYGTDREVAVRLVLPKGDCVLRADPHVFKRLVGFSIARVHAAGAPSVSLRVRFGIDSARIELGPTTAAEEALPSTSLRLVRRLEATDAIVEAAASAAGIVMTACPAGALDVPSAPSISLDVPRVG